MAITMDIGAKASIHPGNKQDVGDRLARLALANDYGEDIVESTTNNNNDAVTTTVTKKLPTRSRQP